MTYTTKKLTYRQLQALMAFTTGTELKPRRTGKLRTADARPLVAHGLLEPTPKTLQCAVKEWTLTPEGVATVARLRWGAAGRITLVETEVAK